MSTRTDARDLTLGGIVLGLATAVVFLGALTIRSGLIFGLIVLALIFIPLERVFALHPQKTLRAGWKTDVVHFAVNNLLATVGLIIPVVTVGLLLRAVVPSAVHHDIAREATWLQLIQAFGLASLGEYAGHRAAHQVPVLWRFHKVHHSIKEMDWLASAHLHPVDQIWLRSCTVIPLFALGFGRASFGGLIALTTIQAIFIHSNVRLTFGPLRWVIATPEFHHWHHGGAPRGVQQQLRRRVPLDRRPVRHPVSPEGADAEPLRHRRGPAVGLPPPAGVAVSAPPATLIDTHLFRNDFVSF